MKLTAFTGLLSWSGLRSWLPSLDPSAYAYPSAIHSRTSTPESNLKTAVEDNRSYYTAVVNPNTI